MNSNTSSLTNSHWYAIRTHLNQENRAEANLRAWNVEIFYPKIKEKRRNQFTGALSSVTKPFFSRYLFAFFPEQMLHKIWFTRGVQSVVSFGGIPSRIDDEIIEFLRARVDTDGFVRRLGEDLKPGDKVTMQGGVLDNLVGVFEREMNDSERVMILLQTINYQGHVIVERSSVRKVAH